MISQTFRRQFLKFFQNKGHALIPSSPVIPHDDPTLLFINAGMNQFKDIFLGKRISDYSSATSSQKCIRVGGKHNDLENVGHTSRHLTFFEMMGNFSFGDYFKKEAIAFAWEVTTTIFKFEVDFLWATVFHEDDEAFELWKSYLPEERIVRRGKKDNFWAMGDIGPCGPCSELLYDRGAEFGAARNPAEDVEEERFLEFWNLVFIEFSRDLTGELHPLPKKCVDTGAGLERVVSLKMGVHTLFETDVLRTLIDRVETISGKKYDPNAESAAAFRVIADHLRSLAFAIADGVQPSNVERGYILRKVLRRAIRYGRQLDLEKPFLADVLPSLVEMMGDDFPELLTSKERISEILTLEEESFLRTLRRGGNMMNQIVAEAKKEGQISGDDAFKLKDTYGFPLEEILLLAKDVELPVDIRRFEELAHEARERSRGARKITEQEVQPSAYEKHGPSTFLGYQTVAAEGVVLGLMKQDQELLTLQAGEEGIVFLDQTPFYAEKGGQVGDQGALVGEKGRFEVLDCQLPFPEVIAHIGVVREGELHVGDRLRAQVDRLRRQKIANNHTATHLLNWALEQILGEHIRQGGSIVEPTRLRFDFSHHKALTVGEIEQIEDLINSKIRESHSINCYELPYEEAQKRREIKQFFGEKYDSTVRVVDIEYSKELCGGTHTSTTGTLGYFRITKEGSIAAGMRRIEAVTGEEAEAFVREKKSESDLLIEMLERGKKEHAKEVDRMRRTIITAEIINSLRQITEVNGIPFLQHTISLDSKGLRECADLIMDKQSTLALLLISRQKNFLVRVSADLVSKGIRANELVKEIATFVGGKGGGRADAAQGSGIELEQIPAVETIAHKWIEQKTT